MYSKSKRYTGFTTARGYRTYYGKKFGSSVVGKAVGNAKAQRAGVKNNYFQTTVENVGISIPFAAQAENTTSYCITPGVLRDTATWKSHTPIARASPLGDKQFRAMCHMYDQMKIIGMKVNIQVTPCGANGAIVAPCTIGTLWNRSATRGECMSNPTTCALSAAEIEACGSTQVSSLGGYSRYSIKRSIYCRDLQEKANWFDTNILYNNNPGDSPLDVMTFTAWNGINLDGSTAPRDIHFFFPALYFYLKRGITTPAETWYMTVRVTYMCVFRNTVNRLDSFCTLNAPGHINALGAKDMDYTSKGFPNPDPFTLTFTNRATIPPPATIPEVDDDDENETVTLTETKTDAMEIEDDPGTA